MCNLYARYFRRILKVKKWLHNKNRFVIMAVKDIRKNKLGELTMEKEVNIELKELTKEQKEQIRKKQNNIKIYSIYRIFSWDLLFYYAIIYLFLTIEKGLSPAEVLQFDAFYIFFKFLMQIPCTLLIQKLGKRKSIVLSNFILAIHILIIMFAINFEMLLVSQILCAFSYIIKGTCESDMLYDSLEHGEKRGKIFAKIDGKANSRYYYIDAISAILSGFLFVINPYLPMVLCFIILLISFLLSTKFEEIHKEKGRMKIKEEIKNIKYGFRNTFKSKRLKSLLLFNALFVALIKILQNLRNAVLIEVGISEQYFGVVFAILGIIMGISAKNQGKIHKKYRNKTLGFLSIPTAVSCLLIGVTLLCNFTKSITIGIVLMLFAVQYIMRGPYYVLIKQYFNNFTNSEKRIRIATTNNLCENIIASTLVFGASYILDLIHIEYTMIIIGCVAIIGFVLLLDYMRGTVGLKPEEYSKKEIS